MSAPAQADCINGYAVVDLSLTPGFTPVVTRSYGQKPFKRLLAYACSGTRLKPGVNEK